MRIPQRIEREKKAKDAKFKADFPDKAAVEARIRAKINGAANLAQLKQATLDVLIGDGQQPGLVDALIALNR